MNCVCGHHEKEHCPEHGCARCPCFKYRPPAPVDSLAAWDRAVAEKLALVALPTKYMVQ